MDKENLVTESTGGHTEPVSTTKRPALRRPSSMVPLRDELNVHRPKMAQRRVSFAPEVTLHKIAFQYRDGSDSDRSSEPPSSVLADAGNDDVQVLTRAASDVTDVGVELLEDSSDEGDADSAPIQAEIPIPNLLDEEKATESPSSDNEMELTANLGQPVSVQIAARLSKRRDSDNTFAMELTEVVGTLKTHASNPDPVSMYSSTSNNLPVELEALGEDEEEPMEFTQPIPSTITMADRKGGAVESFVVAPAEICKETKPEAEQPHPLTKEGIEAEVSSLASESPCEPSEVCVNDGLSEDLGSHSVMDLTQSVGSIETVSMDRRQSVMELTQSVSTVQASHAMELSNTKLDDAMDRQSFSPEDQVQPAAAEAPKENAKEDSGTKSPPPRKRPLEEALESQRKRSEEWQTTTIPLADVTNELMDESHILPAVSLSHFMQDIGIRFYDDLEIGSQLQNRISISLPRINSDDQYEIGEYVLAGVQVPEYELYDFSCKELMQNIEDGAKIFDTISDSTSTINPVVFQAFYNADDMTQMRLRSDFQLIKDYARHEAKKVWYEWRSQLVHNVIGELNIIVSGLQKDKQQLIEQTKQMDQASEVVEKRHLSLRARLDSFKALVANGTKYDEAHMRQFVVEMQQVKEHIEQYHREHSQTSERLKELNSEIQKHQVRLTELNGQIALQTEETQKYKKYDATEIGLLTFKFEVLQAATRCRFVDFEGGELRFVFDSLVKVTFRKDRTARYKLIEHSPRFKVAGFLKVQGSMVLRMVDKMPAVSGFRRLCVLWDKLVDIDSCLYSLSLKHPVRVDDQKGTVVVKYFQSEFNCKLELTLSVDIEKAQISGCDIKTFRIGTLKDATAAKDEFKRECLRNRLVQTMD